MLRLGADLIFWSGVDRGSSGQNSIMPKFWRGGAEGLKSTKLFLFESIDR